MVPNPVFASELVPQTPSTVVFVKSLNKLSDLRKRKRQQVQHTPSISITWKWALHAFFTRVGSAEFLRVCGVCEK